MRTPEAVPKPTKSSALISFTASNVRSYRDEVHLSLQATRLAQESVPHMLQTALTRPVEVLPAAGIFGANASGKSTMLLAMADMRATVVSSFRDGTRSSGIYRKPFALDETFRDRPTRFEVDLILQGVRWQYGFKVDAEKVLEEYAYHFPKGRQALVFDRTTEGTAFGPLFRPAGQALRPLMRDNALLLSVAGATDDDQLGPLFGWFLDNLHLAESANLGSRATLTADLAKNPYFKEHVMGFVRAADLGISDIERLPIEPEKAERQQRAMRILVGEESEPVSSDEEMEYAIADSVHLKHHSADGDVYLNPEYESEGTLVWAGLIGPVLNTLKYGHVLLVDELDASLHPYLVSKLVEMFQDPRLNPRCAQLIFNSHDVTVLGDSEEGVLGRDQIWFAEKDRDGATSIYSLAEFRPRRDESLSRRYLQGRFGAVPAVDPSEFQVGLDLVDS